MRRGAFTIPAKTQTSVSWNASGLLVLALAGMLASCVSYQPKPLHPEKSAAALVSRRLDGSKHWTLTELTQLGIKQHASVAVAETKLSAARAAGITAGTRPNPVASISPTLVTNPGSSSPWVFGFSLDVPVETAGKRRKRISAADAELNAATLDLATARVKAAAGVRKAFVALGTATVRDEVLRKQLEAQEETVKIYNTRIAAGEASRTETMQSRLLLQQTRLLARETEKQQGEARADLAEALGMTAAAIEKTNFDFSALEKISPPPPVAKLRATALRNRTDLLAALADYAVQEAKLRLEVAKQYPDVHLLPGYEYDQGLNKWTIPGITIPLPVFDKNRGPIAEAEARRAGSAALFQAEQAKVIAEVDRALATYRGAMAKLAEADALLAENDKQLSAVTAQAKAGEADRLAIVTADVEHSAAKLARLEALAEVQQAAALLDQATQSSGSTR